MLNLSHLMRAPLRHYEVTMHRKACLNANEGARKCIAYVRATNSDEAKKVAEKLADKAAFKSMSAKEVK